MSDENTAQTDELTEEGITIDAVSCDDDLSSDRRTESRQSLDEFEPYIRSRSVANNKWCASEKRHLTKDELQDLRLKINSRERKRMHDLNHAMDSLRQVIPYGGNPSSRRLSKIGTLLLARSYILLLTKSLEELRSALAKASVAQSPILSALSQPSLVNHTSTPIFPVQTWSPMIFRPTPAPAIWSSMNLPSLPPPSGNSVT